MMVPSGLGAITAVKLAIIRQRYDPHGGAERFVSRAAAAMQAHGTQTTIIAREWVGEAGETIWQRCDPFYLGRIWRDRGFARAVCRVIAGGDFDLVQSHERIPCCDVYRAGDGVHAQWLQYRAKTLSPLQRLWLAYSPFHRHLLDAERRLFCSPRLRAVICNSQMVRDEIARWFPAVSDRLHVIYNGVDLERFHPSRAREHRTAMRERLGVPQGMKILLFVGSGFERKGVKVLLDSFKRLCDEPVFLVVVGKDRHARRFEAYARSLGVAEKIHWAGPQNDVAPWYGLADAFVLPTLYDPFPNAALEALASGLPVITSKHCGTAEIIREGWNGYVCRDAHDPGELAGNLRKALAMGQDMRANARSSAEALGTPQMAQALTRLYARLLEPVQGAP
jgi:UDP-glucose:(heptosyl)LPS alpha-1,3-glucosyltransferase